MQTQREKNRLTVKKNGIRLFRKKNIVKAITESSVF